MICKKCGFDGAIEKDDWITCPHCGAEYFNTGISEESATKMIESIDDGGDDVPEAKAEAEKKEEKKPSKAKETFDFFVPIVAAVIIALLLKTFVFANAVVPTGSMIATINEKDRLIASRLAYRNSEPERYDIILFHFPDNEDQIFVKRVIGLPGETVEVKDGIAYVTDKDGNTIETETSFINPAETPTGNSGPFYVPEKGEIITVIDGFAYNSEGVAVGAQSFIDKYCELDSEGNYVIRENCYFCMGDNRNHSHDSRSWQNHYVAKDKILGKAIFKYYNGFEMLT